MDEKTCKDSSNGSFLFECDSSSGRKQALSDHDDSDYFQVSPLHYTQM